MKKYSTNKEDLEKRRSGGTNAETYGTEGTSHTQPQCVCVCDVLLF